ncbi:MAG: C25 family cysteine peptidase [Bacteroidota bacterium]
MMFRTSCLALFLTASIFSARAEWTGLVPGAPAPAPPRVEVLSDDASGTVLRLDLTGFLWEQLPDAGGAYRTVDLLTEAFSREEGHPEVPCVPVLLAVPDGAALEVEVLESSDITTIPGWLLPPVRASQWEGAPEPPLRAEAAAYAADAPYPPLPVRASDPAVFRDFRIARIELYPIRYNPSRGELRCASSMTVRVSYTSGAGTNPKTSPRRPIAPSFGALYRAALLNYPQVLERLYDGVESGRDVLLCITPDEYAATFAAYASWKHASGLYTVVKKFSEIGANATNPALIKNYLSTAWLTWQHPPTYVLLVGDYGVVPRQQISYDYTFANEDYFVELEGNDYFPEMMIGRFTHSTDYGLQVMINKFMMYEKTPPLTNPGWFRKATVCANDNYDSQIKVKRFTAEVMLEDGGFVSVDTMMSSSPCLYDLGDVTAAINNGRGFLNYRGEGWSSGWSASCYGFHTSDVSSLNNGKMLTFVTSIGCGVAMFDAGGGNCFGEEWVELGTPTAPRGACAFIGPTSNTHTTYNNKIDKGIYVGLFREALETPGQALLRGKLYMYNVYGNEQWVEYHYRVYCMLGDPSIHIWKTTPQPVTITYPPQIALGYNQVEVSVHDSATGNPLGGVRVCLSKDTLHVLGTTDATGRAWISVTPATLDSVALAVRGMPILPKVAKIGVAIAQQHVMPYGDPVVTDTDGNRDGRINPNEHATVTIALRNWGTGTAYGVSAVLTPDDTSLTEVIGPPSVSFGDISPGPPTPPGPPFEVFVKPASRVGETALFHLHLASTSASWEYTVLVPVTGCSLQVTGSSVNDQGSALANWRLDPGETAILSAMILNAGHDEAPGVTGILRSADTLVTIADSVGTFGTVAVGDSIANLTDYFLVTVGESCPPAAEIEFTLVLQTTNGRYPYSVERQFTMEVGTPLPGDPTGPDAYGYYAYSSDDTLYRQAPPYAWVEISGSGTEIPRNGSDFTQTVTLPFPFRYYGINYSSLRVNSDGWVAFGAGTQTAWRNYELPHDDAVNCMVAPFWDDLFAGSGETGRLLYYSDAANHRFIVEWYRVGHYSDPTDRETFQLILLDPAFYPTASGNGEIIFQYHTLVEDGSNTIGIEDHTETVGLQYVYNDLYAATASEIREGFAIKFTTERPTARETEVAVSVLVEPGWNLISTPVLRPDTARGVLQVFPTSSFPYAFAFHPQQGYTQTLLLEGGAGYWGKFPSSASALIHGLSVHCDTVPLAAGWNLIGSISNIVDSATVRTIPPGLITSAIFGYGGGYAPVHYLLPGRAYWVKAGGAGSVVLGGAGAALGIEQSPRGSLDHLESITITDASGRTQTLRFGVDPKGADLEQYFSLPPLPPGGGLDVRFDSPEGGTMVKTNGADLSGEFPIRLRTDAFPVTFSWTGSARGRYELVCVDGGGRRTARSLDEAGGWTLENPSFRGLALVRGASEDTPREFSLGRNYPNPFNPSTRLRYALPVESSVSLEVFNALGQRVRTLLEAVQKPGYHTAVWDGAAASGRLLGSGVYFIRLKAAGADGRSFSAVQKVMLLK